MESAYRFTRKVRHGLSIVRYESYFLFNRLERGATSTVRCGAAIIVDSNHAIYDTVKSSDLENPGDFCC